MFAQKLLTTLQSVGFETRFHFITYIRFRTI